jgi:UDP-glucuronate 4-epimerase
LKKNKKKYICRVVNIGNPNSIDLKYVIKLIEKFSCKRSKKKMLPLQTGDIVKTQAKMKKEINKYKFKFKINIEKGISNFSKWFINER